MLLEAVLHSEASPAATGETGLWIVTPVFAPHFSQYGRKIDLGAPEEEDPGPEAFPSSEETEEHVEEQSDSVDE